MSAKVLGKTVIRAIKADDTEKLQRYLRRDPQLVNKLITDETLSEHSPLYFALLMDSEKSIDLLLRHHVACTAPDAGNVLIVAANKGNSQAVKRLLAAGASIHSVDRSGNTALHHAASGGYACVCEDLVKHGASIETVNDLGKTPLDYANTGAVKAVLQTHRRKGKSAALRSSADDAPAVDGRQLPIMPRRRPSI